MYGLVGLVVGWLGLLSVPVLVSAASVEVVAAKDLPWCEKVAQLFGERLVPDHDLLKTVEWKPVELKGQRPKTRHCSSLDKAVMDLDNDGRLDLVVRATFCMKGAPSDSFYMFSAESDVLDRATWQDFTPLLTTLYKFERTGGTYPLTSLRIDIDGPPPALATLFTVHPFILDGVTFVGLTDRLREWMVIATYAGGERFDDRCYLRAGKV